MFLWEYVGFHTIINNITVIIAQDGCYFHTFFFFFFSKTSYVHLFFKCVLYFYIFGRQHVNENTRGFLGLLFSRQTDRTREWAWVGIWMYEKIKERRNGIDEWGKDFGRRNQCEEKFSGRGEKMLFYLVEIIYLELLLLLFLLLLVGMLEGKKEKERKKNRI